MSRWNEMGKPVDLKDDVTPPEVGQDIGTTPREFGTFAHQAYQVASDNRFFENVVHNLAVVVTKSDGTQAQGYIDSLIDNRVVIDYKTNFMPGWSVADARYYGNKHGQQMREYVESESTPDDAQGWIISTVPPGTQEVRQAYSSALAEHSVGVKFSAGEDQESVMAAVSEAVDESAESAENAPVQRDIEVKVKGDE